MVEKFDAVFGESFARFVEHTDRFAAGGFIEGVLVINPGAAGIFQAKGLRFPGDAFDVLAITVERKMGPYGFELARFKLGLELFGCEVVGAGKFDIFDAEIADLVECTGNIFPELRAQAVELQAYGTTGN